MESCVIPFQREDELCTDLTFHHDRISSKGPNQYLPGHPLISLHDGEVLPFVEKDLLTPSLDKMSPWLWLLASPKSSHIAALHAQIVRGRRIVITEDAELHLVWISDRVFVKPLPAYLCSHAFWSHLVYPNKTSSEADRLRAGQVARTALGYVRTYMHLIRHESDLRIAQREGLVPAQVDLETWAAFIRGFKDVEDWQVSGRYHYGDLRLTRLNFWAKIFLRRWYYRKTTWQYAEYFAKYFAPLLFLFGIWSLVLDSMQVGLQARPSWDRFADVSAWFSVATLVSLVAVTAFLLGAFCVLAGREIWYAFGKQIRKRRRRKKVRTSQKFKTNPVDPA